MRKNNEQIKPSISDGMDGFKTYLFSLNFTKSSCERACFELKNYCDWCVENDLESENATHNILMDYIKFLKSKKQVKQITIQKYLSTIKNYYNHLINENIRETNPVLNIKIKGIKRQQLHSILDQKELENIYNSFVIPLEDHPKSNQNWYKASVLTAKRNKIIIGLLVYQGLDTTALKGLKTEDVKLHEGKIIITQTRKTNARTLELKAHQILDIMSYLMKTRDEILAISKKETELFLVSIGQSNNLQNSLAKLMQKLKVLHPEISSIKQIRASVITHWLRIYNLRQTQYFAGHKYVSSTEKFRKNDMQSLMEDIEKYHPF